MLLLTAYFCTSTTSSSPPSLPPSCTHKLMVTIGNDNANSFWEHHYLGKRLPADVEREIREEFIRAKYQVKSWIATPSVEGKEALSHQLCSSVKTSNLMRTMELLVHGADVSYSGIQNEVALFANSHTREENRATLPTIDNLLPYCCCFCSYI